MVSAADPHGRNLGFLDQTSLEHLHKVLLFFFQKINQFILCTSNFITILYILFSFLSTSNNA
jgi:hypothetical protein